MDASTMDVSFLLSRIDRSLTPRPENKSATSDRQAPIAADSQSQPSACSSAYDAVFTNAALHWVRSPRTVIDSAKEVLRPGGRFVGEFGGHGNMAAVRVAMHSALWRRGVDPLQVDPWYFPTPTEYRRLLEEVSSV